jgi:hypothetical protein
MMTGRLERLTAIAGLGAVALYIASLPFTAPNPPPEAGQPAAVFAAYYAGHRTPTLIAAYLAMLSAVVAVAFLVGVRDVLRRAEAPADSTMGTVGLVAGAVQWALVAAGVAVLAAAAYRPRQPAETLRVLTDTGWVVINLGSGVPTALSVGAFSAVLNRTRAAGPLVVGLGLVVAVAHLVVAGAFARSGPLSPVGAVPLLVPALYYLWVASVSVSLLRRGAPAPAS